MRDYASRFTAFATNRKALLRRPWSISQHNLREFLTLFYFSAETSNRWQNGRTQVPNSSANFPIIDQFDSRKRDEVCLTVIFPQTSQASWQTFRVLSAPVLLIVKEWQEMVCYRISIGCHRNSWPNFVFVKRWLLPRMGKGYTNFVPEALFPK